MSALNYEKFANTVLYLLERSAPARPSLTSLLKMLWYADYWHYRKHLRPITGAQYVALERGPVPDDYKQLFDRLASENLIERRPVKVFGKPNPKQEFVPKAEPNEANFEDSELHVLEEVVRHCAGKSGTDLSNETHRDGPWPFVYEATSPGRPIPYAAFRWVDNMPSSADKKNAAKSLARPAVTAVLSQLGTN